MHRSIEAAELARALFDSVKHELPLEAVVRYDVVRIAMSPTFSGVLYIKGSYRGDDQIVSLSDPDDGLLEFNDDSLERIRVAAEGVLDNLASAVSRATGATWPIGATRATCSLVGETLFPAYLRESGEPLELSSVNLTALFSYQAGAGDSDPSRHPNGPSP